MNKCYVSKLQEYTCQVSTKYNFGVDKCLENEITKLNNEGIRTIGSCCGNHVNSQPNSAYIQVIPEHVQKMIELGYEKIPVDKYDNGHWCFRPKLHLIKI